MNSHGLTFKIGYHPYSEGRFQTTLFFLVFRIKIHFETENTHIYAYMFALMHWTCLVGCRLWGCTELDTTEAT